MARTRVGIETNPIDLEDEGSASNPIIILDSDDEAENEREALEALETLIQMNWEKRIESEKYEDDEGYVYRSYSDGFKDGQNLPNAHEFQLERIEECWSKSIEEEYHETWNQVERRECFFLGFEDGVKNSCSSNTKYCKKEQKRTKYQKKVLFRATKIIKKM